MNYFVSLHGMSHNLMKINEQDYFTYVLKNVEIYTFAPTNYCIYSNEDSEKMMMHFLKNPNWISSPEINEGGMFSNTQLYLENNKITNILLDGDISSNFGVFLLNESFKKMNIVFDTEKKETTYDIERLMHKLKELNPNEKIKIYLCICSPHTICPFKGSIIKWTGKNQPLREATKKYQSFSITDDILKKSKHIQQERLRLDEQGRKRFLHSIPKFELRFTRSMSFPLRLRNGSIDNIPSQIGKGLYEKNMERCGLYYKMDKQDVSVNIQYLNRIKFQIS